MELLAKGKGVFLCKRKSELSEWMEQIALQDFLFQYLLLLFFNPLNNVKKNNNNINFSFSDYKIEL